MKKKKQKRFHLIHNLKASLVSLFNLIVCSLKLSFCMRVLSYLQHLMLFSFFPDAPLSLAVSILPHRFTPLSSSRRYHHRIFSVKLCDCILIVVENGIITAEKKTIGIQIDTCRKAHKMEWNLQEPNQMDGRFMRRILHKQQRERLYV